MGVSAIAIPPHSSTARNRREGPAGHAEHDLVRARHSEVLPVLGSERRFMESASGAPRLLSRRRATGARRRSKVPARISLRGADCAMDCTCACPPSKTMDCQWPERNLPPPGSARRLWVVLFREAKTTARTGGGRNGRFALRGFRARGPMGTGTGLEVTIYGKRYSCDVCAYACPQLRICLSPIADGAAGRGQAPRAPRTPLRFPRPLRPQRCRPKRCLLPWRLHGG